MTFLNAYWKNLVLANYVIDPNVLKPFLPKGTELDFYNNKCYVSLVGFMFMDTRVLGIKFPYHINFEEVNLRFYVKRNDKRGVVFIKEIVPKPLITKIANTLYHEHYETQKMSHNWSENENFKLVSYKWKLNNKWQSIAVETSKTATEIPLNSEEEFITEHYFGYTKHNNKTYQYEVTHPIWKQYKVINYDIQVDFEANYGKAFAFLNAAKPTSILLAEGSKISVKNKTTLRL